jgi:LacI family transcriptional regulator
LQIKETVLFSAPGMPKASRKSSARVTVRSIAASAGVSIGSVSSVMNNRHVERRISLETVEKIRATAAKLGYLPNISARRLRSHGSVKNSVVLALLTSFEAPIPLVNHFLFALRQAMAAGSNYAFSVMIDMFSAGQLKELPGLVTGDHFNAAIILNTIAEDDQFLTRTHLPYPVVLVNRIAPGYSSVIEASDSGVRPAEIFFKSKRRRLAVLHGNPLTQTTRARVDGFMHRANQLLGTPAAEVVADKLSETGAYEATKAFLGGKQRFDALYAVSDALALGAYRAIKEAGLRIPEDVAVIGVGDYQIAPFFDPPLSCVGVSHQQLAEQASQLLMRQLETAGSAVTVKVPVVETLRASSVARS